MFCGTERLYPEAGQAAEQFLLDLLLTHNPDGKETTPEPPPSPLKNALAVHILLPTIRPVPRVAIALDSQPRVVCTLNDHVDSMAAGLDLRDNSILFPNKEREDFLFEIRLTFINQTCNFRLICNERRVKVCK